MCVGGGGMNEGHYRWVCNSTEKAELYINIHFPYPFFIKYILL